MGNAAHRHCMFEHRMFEGGIMLGAYEILEGRARLEEVDWGYA